MLRKFEIKNTEIIGLLDIVPFCAEDVRGNFVKDYSCELFKEVGLKYDIKETFYTKSHKGVIRALHFQRVHEQPKLIRCVIGHIYDVVVDLRKDSSSYLKWQHFDLSEDGQALLIPRGCALGYLALEPSVVSYKCSEIFYSEYDDGIIWNDPDIAIPWPLEKIGGPERLILSDKDKNLQTLREFEAKYGGFYIDAQTMY